VKLYSSVLRTLRNAADAAGSARPKGKNAGFHGEKNKTPEKIMRQHNGIFLKKSG
jgi:hypothetical protein